MNRVKTTRLYREKRKILFTYLATLALLMFVTVLLALFESPERLFFLYMGVMTIILTLMFLIAYRNPAAWGWMMFGRSRVFSGNPWQSRVGKELTHIDTRSAVEERMEYEEALYHEKPEALQDLRNLREEAKDRNRIELPRPEPGEGNLAEGVLKCPQCETPYVFDPDNPVCVRCGTRLHRGEKPSE